MCVTLPVVAGHWKDACRAAGVDGGRVLLIVVECDAASADHGAMFYDAGEWPDGNDYTFPYTEEQRERLWVARDRPALVVASTVDPAVLPLLLRHEAEHLVQSTYRPAIGAMAVRLIHGLSNATGLDHGGDLYFALPHERDADAAATEYAARLGVRPTPEQLLGGDRMLFSAPWEPPDRMSLPRRQVAFAALLGDDFERACQDSPRPVDPVDLLEQLEPGSADRRAGVGAAFVQTIPALFVPPISADTWEATDAAARRRWWDQKRSELVQAEEIARHALWP